MTLQILHTSDWHLGSRFGAFKATDAQTLGRARFDALDQVFGLAQQRSVDALLCAGDLFDCAKPSEAWWGPLLRRFEAWPVAQRCPVFLLPGNHDPLNEGSVWSVGHPFRRQLPDFVHVVDKVGYQFELPGGAVLFATPVMSQAGAGDPTASFPAREPGDERIRIGLAHGMTHAIAGQTRHFPIDPNAAQNKGLDYLALGDLHSTQEVRSGLGATVYCGALDPVKFGEDGAGAAALVFFRRAGRPPLIRHEPVGQWRWRNERVESMEQLRALRQGNDLARTVLKLSLRLTVSLEERREIDQLLELLLGTEATHGMVGIVQSVDKSELRVAPHLDQFANLPEILEKTARRIDGAANRGELDAAVAQRALYHLYQLANRGPS